MDAATLFEDSIDWLRDNYANFRFFAERDIVWTVQLDLLEAIKDRQLPHQVFHGHRIGQTIADLVLRSADGQIEVAAEFKYEPSHARTGDFAPKKLSQDFCFWSDPSGSVCKDVERVRRYVEERLARVGYSLFIDEGGRFRHREAPPGAGWTDWPGGVSVLSFRVE